MAKEQAQRRLDVLAILGGTAPAQGPGIRIVIYDPNRKVTPELLLNTMEEMRDAGAEVIAINNTVRVVASTWFSAGPSGLLVDGHLVTVPISIDVIGDPHALTEATRFSGGLISEMQSPRIAGTVTVTTDDKVTITAVITPAVTVRQVRPEWESACGHSIWVVFEQGAVASVPVRPRPRSSPVFPDDLQYTDKHEWVRSGNGSTVRVGITSYAADALGDVVYVSLPQVGEEVAQEDACVEVESTKSVSDVFSPASGVITSVNEMLNTTPEVINTDPYGDGWMFELEISDSSELDETCSTQTSTPSWSRIG